MKLHIPATLVQAGTDEGGATTLIFTVSPEDIKNIPLPLYRESILVITPAPQPECCDEPRGLVGAACDHCGGIVQPEQP